MIINEESRLALNMYFYFSFTNSPSQNESRNIRKQEERNADLVSPDGCISSGAPKYPEKGKGKFCSTL